MKRILANLRWSEVSLPVVAVLSAALILLPASQLAVLGLLRATQKSPGQSMLQSPPADDRNSPRGGRLLSDTETTEPVTASAEVRMDALMAMAAAMNRERRAVERHLPPSISPSRPSAHKSDSVTGQTRFQGPDAAFSAALSSVFAQAAKLRNATKPFAIEFVSLPLRSASALTPVFALAPGVANGEAWAQMHPDLRQQTSVAVLQVTLSRTLGRKY